MSRGDKVLFVVIFFVVLTVMIFVSVPIMVHDFKVVFDFWKFK